MRPSGWVITASARPRRPRCGRTSAPRSASPVACNSSRACTTRHWYIGDLSTCPPSCSTCSDSSRARSVRPRSYHARAAACSKQLPASVRATAFSSRWLPSRCRSRLPLRWCACSRMLRHSAAPNAASAAVRVRCRPKKTRAPDAEPQRRRIRLPADAAPAARMTRHPVERRLARPLERQRRQEPRDSAGGSATAAAGRRGSSRAESRPPRGGSGRSARPPAPTPDRGPRPGRERPRRPATGTAAPARRRRRRHAPSARPAPGAPRGRRPAGGADA